jgi:hypothetical protein
MEGRFLLDVVVGESAAVLKLLASEDQSLLIRRDTLLVLDLRLDIVDRVGRLNLQSDGLASERLDDCTIGKRKVSSCENNQCVLTDLHASTETKDQVKG